MKNSLAKFALVLFAVACGAPPAAPVASSTTLQAVMIESLTIGEVEIENPDWMVTTGEIIWTMSDPEFEDELSVFALKGIDPESNEVAITVDRLKSGCDAIGAHGDSVWVCDDDTIRQLDSQSGETRSVIEFEMSWDQGPIPIDESGIWVLNRDSTALVHLDGEGAELGRAELPSACDQVALLQQAVYVSCGDAQSIIVIDKKSYTITDEVQGIEAGLMAADGDRLWVGFPHESGGVGWLEPDGEVETVAGSPDVSIGCLLVDGDSLWARGSDIHLVRIDRASGEVVETYLADRSIGGGCVVRAHGALWVGSVPFGKVWKLDLPA
jgi:hypothetical protein